MKVFGAVEPGAAVAAEGGAFASPLSSLAQLRLTKALVAASRVGGGSFADRARVVDRFVEHYHGERNH